MKTLSLFLFIFGLLALEICGCNKSDPSSVTTALLKRWTLTSIQDTKSNQITSYPGDYSIQESVQFTDSLTLVFYG
jgi:hypothetical protein